MPQPLLSWVSNTAARPVRLSLSTLSPRPGAIPARLLEDTCFHRNEGEPASCIACHFKVKDAQRRTMAPVPLRPPSADSLGAAKMQGETSSMVGAANPSTASMAQVAMTMSWQCPSATSLSCPTKFMGNDWSQ